MLESCFESAPMLERLRCGLSGPFIDGFADALRESGYAHSTMRCHLRAAAHVGEWAASEGLSFGALDEHALGVFTEHLRACTCFWRGRVDESYVVAGARRFLAYLEDRGVTLRSSATTGDALPPIVERFEHWMRRHRRVTPSTLATYRPILVELVGKLSSPDAWTTAALRQCVSERAARHGRSRAKTVVAGVRMLLRHLSLQGLVKIELVDAIPTIAGWRLSSLPRYLCPEDVERIVRAPDPATPMGRRDRAILLLLARLGLRAGEVVHLCLSDIDWQSGTLVVDGKGHRSCRLPLPQDAGDAILAYVADGRPRVADEHVFLRVHAPLVNLGSSSAVSMIVRSAAKRAGVKIPRGQAHALRHSVATALLRGGVPLSAVGIVLRHHSEDTTAHYAKVDVVALRTVVRAWPLEVSPC